MDCCPPGSLVHGIFQAWILEWVAISFSRGSSRPWDWIQVSSIVGRRFTIWATREAYAYISQVALVVKNPPANARDIRDTGLIPGSGRSLGEGNDSPFQCFFLEKSMDRGAWWATVNGVEKNQTWLSMLAHTVFQTFSWLLCLIWSSAISDLWCYYCNCFGVPWTLTT